MGIFLGESIAYGKMDHILYKALQSCEIEVIVNPGSTEYQNILELTICMIILLLSIYVQKNIPLAMGPIQGLYRTFPHISEAFPIVQYYLNEWKWCCTCLISPSASPCKYAPSEMNIARVVVAH